MKAKIEKYLEENNLAYARALRTELGEYVSIGDLIDNYTKALIKQPVNVEVKLKNEILNELKLEHLTTIEGKVIPFVDSEMAVNKIQELQEQLAETKQTGLEAIKIAEDLSAKLKKYEARVEDLQKQLAAKEKECHILKELHNYILDIDWLTTTEFCNKFNIPHLKFTGEVESSVCEMLRIDAVKHRMFVEKAKEIRKNLTPTN